MRILTGLLPAFVFAVAFALTGCSDRQGNGTEFGRDLEDTGREIERGAEDTGREIERGIDDIGD